MGVIYILKNHKSPGYDHILNEDVTAAILEDTDKEVCISPSHKLSILKFIFKTLSDIWFNEFIPRDLKRTIIRPFIKDFEKASGDPSNYRPILLLNTFIKIYKGIICKSVQNFLNKNRILSPNQAAYCMGRSTSDDIFVLHELFLEYRYRKAGSRGGKMKKLFLLSFLDLRKPLIVFAA